MAHDILWERERIASNPASSHLPTQEARAKLIPTLATIQRLKWSLGQVSFSIKQILLISIGEIMVENTQKKCTACDGDLEEGFIIDHKYGNLWKTNAKWAPGKPSQSGFLGVYVDEDKLIALKAYHCISCNRVEFFLDT